MDNFIIWWCLQIGAVSSCFDFIIAHILGGNPLLLPVDDGDLLAEEDEEEDGDKVRRIKKQLNCR